MKTYSSMYIKKNLMDPADVTVLEDDIQRFSLLFRSMVHAKETPRKKDEPSIHVQFKGYGLSDYMVTSLERAATGVIRSAKECLANNVEDKESQINQINEKIKTIEHEIQNMQKVKDALVARSKSRKNGKTLPKFSSYFGSGIYTKGKMDLSFEVDHDRGKAKKRKRPPLKFENEYLFELLYVDPYIKRRRQRIRVMKARIHNLTTKLAKLKADLKSGHYHIHFGGKKLMQQRQTTENVEQWHNSYKKARTREMLLVGRYDATQGNFMARYEPITHLFTYTSISGKVISLYNVIFPYGGLDIRNAVNASMLNVRNKNLLPEERVPCWPRKPVTWAIKDCGNAFMVRCMIDIPENPNMNTCYDNGCVAFDMNYDHLAVAELNRYGQLLKPFVVHFKMDGRTSNQIENAISEALEDVFKYAVLVNKPVAMERIENLKKELMYGQSDRNRKISQFAYAKMDALAENKSQKYGVAIRKINPACTSQIGKLKYMKSLGLSIHEAAAYVIGRRAMGFKDKVPDRMRHLIPKKQREKHHWSQWAGVSNPLKTIPVCKFYNKIDYTSYSTMTALKKALA